MEKTVPSPVMSRIKSIRRRANLWFLADGLSRLAITLLLCLAGTFWIDFLIRDLPGPVRLSFLAAAIIVAGFILLKKTVIPLVKLARIKDEPLIFLIEKRFPELKERLINLWQLPDSSVASELTAQIIPVAQSRDFNEILLPNSSKKLALGALALLLVSIICSVLYPSEINIWRRRLMGQNLHWPKRTVIAFKAAPDYTVARGQNLSITAWPSKGPKLNAIYILIDSGRTPADTWERMPMLKTKSRQPEFRQDFTRISAPFRFRLKGGDDQTGWIQINVLDAPALEKISARYEYPPYTGLENKTVADANINAPAGTRITINALAEMPLQAAELTLNEESIPITMENNRNLLASLIVNNNGKYSFRLTGANGLKNIDPIEYSIKLIPDNHPSIKVMQPDSELLYVTPEAIIPLKSAISDDYGISNARIIYTLSGDAAEPAARSGLTLLKYEPPAGRRTDKIELLFELDLAGLNPQEGAYLILNFTASDNRELRAADNGFIPAPQTATSTDYVLAVISRSQLEKKVSENILQIKDDLKKTLQIQEAARQSPAIHQALANQRRVTQNLGNSSEMLVKTLADINHNGLFTPDIAEKLGNIKEDVSRLSQSESPSAQQSLEKSAMETNGSGRDQAAKQQQEISDKLQNILDSMQEWEDYQEVVNNVRDLLSETQNLAEKIKQSSDPSGAHSDMETSRLNEMVKNLREESDHLADKMERVSEKLKDTQPYYSDKLRQGQKDLRSENGVSAGMLSLQANLNSSFSGKALQDAENIKNALTGLLDFLEDRLNPEETRAKIAELKKAMEEVSRLKSQEEQLAEDTARILDPTGRISEAARELDSLLMSQKMLSDVTGQAFEKSDPDKLADILKKLAAEQQDLETQARALARQLDQANRELKPQPNPDVQSAAQSLQSSAQNMAQANQHMEEQSGNPENQPPSDRQSGQQAKEESKKLSAEQQDKALRELRQARESVKKFISRPLTAEEKRRLETLARRQKEIQEAAEQAAQKSEKESKESMQKAAQRMSQARQKLSESRPEEAEDEARAAIEELERLYEMLDNKIGEMEQRQKQNQMEKLHAQLKKILDAQTEINVQTSVILDQPDLSRRDLINLRKISGEQLQLSDSALELRKKLETEKSQTFAWTLGNIRDDMQLAARLTAQPDPINDSAYIQEIQSDLARKLKDLLDAFKNEMNRRKPLQTDGSGGKEDEQLMSIYAELKMARTIQEYLISRTESIKKELLKRGGQHPAMNALLQRLASEQGHLAEMVKELAKILKEKEDRKQKH